MNETQSPTETVNKSVQLQPNASGLLTVWLDTPDRTVNVFDADMLAALESAIEHIAANSDRYRAVVFRTKKPGCFFVGADVNAIAAIRSESEIRTIIERGQILMSNIECLPVPTIAAIDGICMGGGLEFALACHHRIATDSPKTKLGLPEIKLGLIPGWGGTQRLPAIVGLQQTLTMILTGKTLSASKAIKCGLVDQVFASSNWERDVRLYCDHVMASSAPRSEQFVSAGASSSRRDDQAGCVLRSRRSKSVLRWLLDDNWMGQRVVFHMASRKIASQRKHYPALDAALHAVRMACATGGRALDVECYSFVRLLFTDTAQSLLGLFVQRDQARKVATWVDTPQTVASPKIQSVAIIGAGAMGAGIGALAARNGFDVVFKEIDERASDGGRKRVDELWQSQVDRRRMSGKELDHAAARTHFTEDWQDLADCDLAIEAVVEVEPVKREVFQLLDQFLRPQAILASNTSSLCVTRMATATQRRSSVAGLHFFNPVDRMELVEVVQTEATDQQTIASLLSFVRALGKTPIVTSDKPGFLVNRVLFPYLGEAVRMVSEGYDIADLDRQMRSFGMPMGPLELVDRVGVDIASHVAQSLGAVQPDNEIPASLLAGMVEKGWLGKKSERGFYDYCNASRREVNALIPQDAIAPRVGLDFQHDGLTSTKRRLVYPILNEAVHCLDELVVTEPWMVDLGMVLGTGFAPMHGGPLRLIDLLGPDTVLHNMRTLADAYGERFAPADGLIRVVRRKETFFSSTSESLTWEQDHESRYSTQS